MSGPGARPCGEFVRTHAEDERVPRTRFARGALVAGLLVLLAPPLVLGNYLLAILCGILIAVVAATGLNILTGYTGLISVGHGAFMGVGGYTAAILATAAGWPWWATLPAAGAVTALAGVVFGLPSFRLKRFYLAIATLAAQFILEYAFMNWESLTKGAIGILVPRPAVCPAAGRGPWSSAICSRSSPPTPRRTWRRAPSRHPPSTRPARSSRSSGSRRRHCGSRSSRPTTSTTTITCGSPSRA